MNVVDDNAPAPLANIRIVTMALNLPGPVAVRRLVDLGASAVKVEPPDGDPLRIYARDYYRELHQDIAIHRVDLKSDAGQAELSAALEEADLLITAQRPAALKRLGLSFANIRNAWPKLSLLEIVGHAPPEANRAGHDLTYIAQAGLLQPPHLPMTLMADLLGAERAVSAAFALLRQSEHTDRGEYAQVALEDAAHMLAAPLRHGLTRPSGLLGGAHPGYALYRTADGWVALAALEAHFLASVVEALEVDGADMRIFAAKFAAKTGAEWEHWAEQHDIPLTVL